MFLIDRLAEERIQQALNRGDLNDLPAMGKRLELDDDSHVPADLRAAYRLLKNAGFVPPEVEWRREIRDIELLLHSVEDREHAEKLRKRLLLLRLQAERSGRSPGLLWQESEYQQKLLDKLVG